MDWILERLTVEVATSPTHLPIQIIDADLVRYFFAVTGDDM